MLFVLSAHFESAFWVSTQRRFLDAFIDVPQKRMFTSHGLDKRQFLSSETVFPYQGNHWKSLDYLAKIAVKDARDDDYLLFLDSDSFPIQPISGLLGSNKEIIAVQRLENLGDPQPHPCFCLMKVATYRELNFSWKPGLTWIDWFGTPRTDVGAGLLESILKHRGTEWTPLHRLKTRELHPLFFAVYGNKEVGPAVYHHGAGSRSPRTRVETSVRKKRPGRFFAYRLLTKLRIAFSPGYRALFAGFFWRALIGSHYPIVDSALQTRMASDLYFWTIFNPHPRATIHKVAVISN